MFQRSELNSSKTLRAKTCVVVILISQALRRRTKLIEMSDMLEGTHGGFGGLKGGLIRVVTSDSKHTFQAPADKPRGVSLLGLDKLAQKKREIDAQIQSKAKEVASRDDKQRDRDIRRGNEDTKRDDGQRNTGSRGGRENNDRNGGHKRTDNKYNHMDRDRNNSDSQSESNRKRSRSRSTEKVRDNRSDSSRSKDANRGDQDRSSSRHSNDNADRERGGDRESSRDNNRDRDNSRSSDKYRDSSRSERHSERRSSDSIRYSDRQRDATTPIDRDRSNVRRDGGSTTPHLPVNSSHTPSRSGIGIDENEWEQPERLCTSSNARGVTSGTPLGTPLVGSRTPMTSMTGGETGTTRASIGTPLMIGSERRKSGESSRDSKEERSRVANEWDHATPLRGEGGEGSTDRDSSKTHSVSGEEEENEGADEDEMKLPSSTPRTALSRRAMQRAGFLVQDTPMLGEGDNGDGALIKGTGGSRGRKFYDPDEEDDEYGRDYYLSEEGPTFDTGGDSSGAFLGSAAKFKQREDQMAKSRAKGEGKIAGMSARKSQLHVDQSAWEDNRMLQSG